MATAHLEHERDSDRRRCGTCHGPWVEHDAAALLHVAGCAAATATCARCGDTDDLDTWPAFTFAPMRCRCVAAPP